MAGLLKLKRICGSCGRDEDAVQLITVTPQLWRKPREQVLSRKEQGQCLKMGRGVVVCDDCFALAVKSTEGPTLWRQLSERLIATYKQLREVSA